MEKEHLIPWKVREDIALFYYVFGVTPTYSTDIAGFLTCGYGKLDEYGFWEYPLHALAAKMERELMERLKTC